VTYLCLIRKKWWYTAGMIKKQRRGAKGEGSLYKRGAFWWYKTPQGERFPTGTQIKSEATDFKLRKLTALRTDQPHLVSKARGATVNELLDAHLAHMRRKDRKSAQDVEWVLNLHVRPYFGERVASKLGTADFEQYRKDKADLAPTTVNRHLSYIRSGYVTGHKRVTPRMVDFIPAFPIVDESYNVRQGFLTFEGYEKILPHLPESIRPLFICAFHVSSRKGELKNVLWSQVDFEEGLILLDRSDTKNKTGRGLPIYGDMLETLTAQKALRDRDFPECEHVFFWHRGDVGISNFMHKLPGTHIGQFAKTWKSAVKAAGYPNLLFHDLRRTAERNMTKAGMDQSMRMKISGHKTANMSIRYNIVVAADVADEKSKLDHWFKGEKAALKRRAEELKPSN
jgi:integrase